MSVATQTLSLRLNNVTDQVEHSQHREPLELHGVLNDQEHFDITPIIGREYPSASLKEWLEAPNSDELIRDLAITSNGATACAKKLQMLTKRSFSAGRGILPQTRRSR
jgi:hypothetical protein